MRLVDDDCEVPIPLAVPDLVQNVGELLHRGDNDLLARLDEAAQTPGSTGLSDGCANLRELADGVADLAVQNPAVRDHHDGVEDG